MIEVQIDDTKIRAALSNLAEKTSNLRPVLESIGEDMMASTKHRFNKGVTAGPDGTKWLLNSVLSTLLYKDGDTPLTGETGNLMNSINYQMMQGGNGVEIGSPLEYAAMQQFGGTKAEFPHLWGDIPARPFLGLSSDDEKNILETISDYLAIVSS